MPVVIPDGAPCAVDATLWRECLKTFDYGPDRPKGACEAQRQSYYSCIKDWKSKSTGQGYSAGDYYTTPKCAPQAEKLHVCMMTGLFDIANCRRQMLELKYCGYTNDPQVRQALQDDVELQQYIASRPPDSGAKLLWHKLIGKA